MGAILGAADTPALALPQLQGTGASSTADQTLLVQNELIPHVTTTLTPASCPTRGRGARKPSREDTEILSLPSKTQGCFSKALLPGQRGALGSVLKVALTTRSMATTSIPTPTRFPKGEEDPRRRAGLCLAATAARGVEASHAQPQRGFRSRRLETDCRHGLGLQGHAMQKEFVVFHRSRAGGHLPGGCRSILSGRPAEAAAKGPGHFRTVTRGARMTWQTGSQE